MPLSATAARIGARRHSLELFQVMMMGRTVRCEHHLFGTWRRSRKRLRGILAVVGVVLVAAFLTWLVGLVQFASSIPEHVAQPDRATDAIVVLTGGTDRVATGLRLLAENKAQRALISGVHPETDINRLVEAAGQSTGAIAGRVDTGRAARDTAGNAAETAAWMQEHGFHSLRLVTSSYHMPRSLLEMSRRLPNTEIIPHPVLSNNVRQWDWWQSPGTASLIAREYMKYLLAWLTARCELLSSPTAEAVRP
jgi:uncharacterized SAM-binding protein YcdF (DUF218 family)